MDLELGSMGLIIGLYRFIQDVYIYMGSSYLLGQSYMDTLILTSLLVLMGISTFTSKEFVIFCRVSKTGNDYMWEYNEDIMRINEVWLMCFFYS